MPLEEVPSAQSTHTRSLGFAEVFTVSAFTRQEPVFLRLHHAGSVGAAVWMSIQNSFPDTWASGLSSTNEPTRRFVPTFDVHANERFRTPPSP